MLVRPWFARGTQDVIDGYRVAMRPRFGERPIWFGGGTLGKDLSLPRLREEWPDTPQTATAAAAEWRAAWRGVRIANPGRETTHQSAAPPVREQIGQDIELLAQRLRIARDAHTCVVGTHGAPGSGGVGVLVGGHRTNTRAVGCRGGRGRRVGIVPAVCGAPGSGRHVDGGQLRAVVRAGRQDR